MMYCLSIGHTELDLICKSNIEVCCTDIDIDIEAQNSSKCFALYHSIVVPWKKHHQRSSSVQANQSLGVSACLIKIKGHQNGKRLLYLAHTCIEKGELSINNLDARGMHPS